MAKRSRHKGTTRFISAMLSVLLVVNTLGLSAFAADDTASIPQIVTASDLSDPAQDPAGESNELPTQDSADESDEELAQPSEDESDDELIRESEDESKDQPPQDSEDESDEEPGQAPEDESNEQSPQEPADGSIEEQLEAPVREESVSHAAVGAADDTGDDDPAEISDWASLQAAINAAEEGATITVNDITAGPSDSALKISKDKKITLELKGTLDRGLTEAVDDGSVIINYGELTITGGGTITGGNTTGYGGGIWNNGPLTLDNVRICNNHAYDHGGAVYSSYDHLELIDGEITGNSAKQGGGFYVEIVPDAMTMQGGSIWGNNAEKGAGVFVGEAGFVQNGGRINENRASNNGSGVYLQYASYEMAGGSISENTSGSHGGGVFLENSSFEMTGGSIIGNTAGRGGAIYFDYGTLTLAGGTISANRSDSGAFYLRSDSNKDKICVKDTGVIDVTGNIDTTQDNECNIKLPNYQLITVEKTPVAGSRIGITTASQPTYGHNPQTNYVKFADLSDGVNANDAAESFSSDEGFAVDFVRTSLYLKYNRITTWSQLQDALDDGGEQEWFPPGDENGDWIHIIRLTDDITAGSDDRALRFQHPSTGYEIILDLCGHSIDRGLTGLTHFESDGYVLHIKGGDLIIRDSIGGGKITGGNSNYGGGVYIEKGTLTLESGTITGNRAYTAGGVYIEGGVLRQTGGSITGNSAAQGGGIFVNSSDTYEISGTPVVTDNTDEYSKPANVFLNNGATISVTGELLDGAELGIGSDSAHAVTSGYAEYYDGNDPVGQYFVNDQDYYLYFGQNREVAGEVSHDMQLVWNWPEAEDGGQATLEMKCVNCGEAEWSEPADITGPGEYSEQEGGFEFTAEATHDGETYSGRKYVAPEHVETVEPFIDEDGEYHSGTEEHYTLRFNSSTYYYKASGDKPGEQTDPASLARDLFLIDGETIRSYLGELSGTGDEAPVIVLPKTCDKIPLKTIGDGSDPFYDAQFEGAVTIDVTYMTDNGPEVAPNAFPGSRNVTITGPHACHLKYGEHNENNNHYTVMYSDHHVFQAVKELTEWSEDFSSAVIHIECIRESCCYCDIAIEDTTVTSELVGDKIEFFATGKYNGSTYTVSTMTDAFTVQLNPDNGTGETASIDCAKTYRLPGSSEIGFTAPVGTALHGWKDESGTEYAVGDLVTLTSSTTKFFAVWSSEWALVNSALQAGETVILRNDITAEAGDAALTVPAGVTASLDFNGHTVSRGLSEAAGDGYVIKADGVLNMSSNAGGAKGLITGGYNSGDGGGLYVAETGNVDITDVDIKSNRSSSGAGVYVAVGGTAVITGCAVMYNIASAKGGGAFVSEAARFSVKQGSQIIENVAQEGAGVYIKTGGSSTYTGPNVKVKNNTKPNGDFNNIHPESIVGEAPVVISGSMTGMFLGFSIGSLEEASSYLAMLCLAALGLNLLEHIVFDVSNKNERHDQEEGCDHPSRSASWDWNADYTEATATLTCNRCGHPMEASDEDPQKSVGSDGVTTYTAHVQHKDQVFEDKKYVLPYIVTLKPGKYCHVNPVIKKVPHDKNRKGRCKLDLPANFNPEGFYIASMWSDDETQRNYIIGSVIDVDKDMTLTMQWAGAVPVTYKKGVDDPRENDYMVLAEYDKDHEFLPCDFKRKDYDFTKWKIIEAGVIIQGMYKYPGEKLKARYDIEAVAQWQSKWTTLNDKMGNTREDTTVIDLKENVTAQEGDKELLVPEGKTVTLNMKGYTLDRNLSAAAKEGSVIRVKGTLILNGPGTLTGGYSTDSASGIILESGGTLKISGALTIMGNGTYFISDKNSRNVYVPENAKIEVTGALNDAKIGITTGKKPDAGSPVVFTNGLKGNGGKDNFVSDDSSYEVNLNEKGEAILETQAVTVNGVTGSFNDKIKLNYYFDIPDEVLQDENAYVTLTNDRTGAYKKQLIKDAKSDAEKGLKFSILLAAKEASDNITAKVFDGQGKTIAIKGKSGEDYTSTGVKYSLMQYFDWLKSDTSSSTDKEKAVGAAAKDYCIAAQIYFDYHAEGLSVSDAVGKVTDDELSGYIAGRAGTLPQGVSIKGISAMLESDNTLRLYYSFKDAAPADFTFAIDGKSTALKQRSDGMYYLALAEGVYSNRLQNTHTYSITYGTDEPDDTNTYTITASVLTYARSCAIKSNKTESDLGKALYLYNQAAIAAFGN